LFRRVGDLWARRLHPSSSASRPWRVFPTSALEIALASDAA
jgi:hypothetical protein